jgi:hypothetical protein
VTGPDPGPDPEPDDSDSQAREDWIRDIDAALSAAGLTTQLNQTAGGLDVTATIHLPGRKPAGIVVDEDVYVELRWWSDPAATPQHVTAAITSALTAAAGVPPATTPTGES